MPSRRLPSSSRRSGARSSRAGSTRHGQLRVSGVPRGHLGLSTRTGSRPSSCTPRMVPLFIPAALVPRGVRSVPVRSHAGPRSRAPGQLTTASPPPSLRSTSFVHRGALVLLHGPGTASAPPGTGLAILIALAGRGTLLPVVRSPSLPSSLFRPECPARVRHPQACRLVI